MVKLVTMCDRCSVLPAHRVNTIGKCNKLKSKYKHSYVHLSWRRERHEFVVFFYRNYEESEGEKLLMVGPPLIY
jgi:hypothetical protein